MALAELFILVWAFVWIGAMVLWIVTIVQVVKVPEWQFRAVGSEKTNWILVVVLVGVIGALIWHLAGKPKQIRAAAAGGEPAMAAGSQGAAPAGWYPEPGSQTLRWWDGSQWTEHRHEAADG